MAWDDEEGSQAGSQPTSPIIAAATRRTGKFDDEEDNDSDVLDSWDAADDSDVEREKEAKAAEAKAKAEAEAAANKKSKAERIAERKAERAAAEAAASQLQNETEEEKRERMRQAEKESDLLHAEDLFANIGVPSGRKAQASASVVALDATDPTKTVDLSTLPIFQPKTKPQFDALRAAIGPLVNARVDQKKLYTEFLSDLCKDLSRGMASDQIKKVASTLTAVSNEKLREEKAEKNGKKTKAQKTKTSVNLGGHSSNSVAMATTTYDDDDAEDFDDGDFM